MLARQTIVLGGLVLGVSILLLIQLSGASQEGPTPFTALKLITMLNGSGVTTKTMVVLDAVRGDGSRVTAKKLIDNKPVGTKVIVDTPSLQRVAVDPTTESVTTYPLLEEAVRRFVVKPSSCGEEPSAERSELVGYPAVKTLTGNHVSRDESWVALTLDCYPLYNKSSLLGEDGAILAETITEALVITPGEPDPTLFEVPSHYLERSPSEVFVEAERLTGESQCCEGTGPVLDEAYYRHQQNR